VSAIAHDPALVGAAGPPAEVRSQHGLLRQVLREQKPAAVGVALILIFVVLAVGAPVFAPYSPVVQSCPVFAAPSFHHWLGCDDGGVDLLSEIMYGGRVSLIIGFAATVVAMVIGGGVGIVSGYFGRFIDNVLMRITDYLLVIPDLAFAMVVADVWGPSLLHIIFVIAILEWASTARVIRAQVKSLKERTFVKRAQAIGASDTRIIFRHVLPQVGPLLMANTVLTIAVAIYLETALAFLGLESPTAITWGTILQNAFDRAAISAGAWWAIIPDGIAITLVIMGCFLLGQAIEDALNPRLRVAHLGVRRWSLRPLAGRGPDAI
jgi:peptide/nickel transport system permease protein